MFVNAQIDIPTGTGYAVTLTGLKNIGAGIFSPITRLAGKLRGRITPERRVKDAGQGDYRLYRRGETGSIRLNIVARLANPARSAKQAVADATAEAKRSAPRPPVSRSSGPGALASDQSFDEAKETLKALAEELRKLRAEAINAGIESKRGRNLDTQYRLKEVALEQAVTTQLNALANLAPEERAEAERFLFKQLIAVHLPGVADHLTKLEKALDGGSLGELVKDLAQKTGREVLDLLLRNQPGFAKDEWRDEDKFEEIIDGFGRDLLTGVVEDLRTLYKAGLFPPALIRRLSDVGPMRAWAGEEASPLNKLDATFAFRDMLRTLVSGNRTTINFLLGGDSRLDEYALRLKLKMNEGKDGFDEETVRLQHALDTAKRTLQELLRVRQEAWGKERPGSHEMGQYRKDKVDTVINEGGSDQIRVDSRLIQALRNPASKSDRTTVRADADAGRDVNMLIAYVMLLQKRLDAKQGAEEVRRLEAAKADAAAKLLEEARLLADERRLDELPPDDDDALKTLSGAVQGAKLRAIRRALALDAEVKFARLAEEDGERFDRKLAAESAASRADLEAELSKELKWLGDVMFGSRKPTIEDLSPYERLADAFGAYDPDNRELAKAHEGMLTEARGRAEADLKLGLDEQDLLAMGFSQAEVDALMDDLETELHGIVGGIARQGLRNSQEVKQVNDAINKIVDRLLGKGMSQDTLSQLSGRFAEGRADLFLYLVYRGVSGGRESESQESRLGADDETVKAAFKKQVGAYLTADDAAADTEETMDKASAEHGKITLGIASQAARLGRLDEELKAAKGRLKKLGDDLHLKIDPDEPKDFELAKTLLVAVQTYKILEKLKDLRDYKGVEEDIAELSHKLDQDLAALRKLDRNTMRGSIFFGKGPITREELRRIKSSQLEVAQHIVTIRSIPGEKAAVMRDIENRAKAADDILAQRRNLMGPSHAVLRNAIRAAILEVRAAAGVAVKDFDPADFRDQIEERLQHWGIDPKRYAPELGEAIHRNFDAAEIERWIADAKTELGDAAFRETVDPSRAMRSARFLKRVVAFDNQKIDYVTRQTVIDTVKTMQAGDKIYVARGDGGTFYTGRIPVEKSGTLRVSAKIKAAERKLFEVQKTKEGFELFFKAGLQGSVTGGAYVDLVELVDVGGDVTGSGNRLAGAGLRFTDEAALERFLRTLLGNGRVSPADWKEAEETVLVTDRMAKVALGLEARASSSSLAEKLGLSEHSLMLDFDLFGGDEAQIFAGLEARLDASGEVRWIEEKNAGRRVVEKEVVFEVGANFRAGAYLILPTTTDFLLDKTVASNTSLKDSPYDPFTSNFYTPLAVGVEKKLTISEARRRAYRRDGLLDDSGNEITKTYTAQGPLSPVNLALLKPNFTRDEAAAGAADTLLEALTENRNGFRDEVKALLGAAEPGDNVAVTYALRDDIRTVINDNLKEARRLREEARGGANATAEREAAAREDIAKRLYTQESSYVANQIQLVKKGGVNKDLRIVGMRMLNWSRYAEGGVERPAITLNVPSGPADRTMAGKAEDRREG